MSRFVVFKESGGGLPSFFFLKEFKVNLALIYVSTYVLFLASVKNIHPPSYPP